MRKSRAQKRQPKNNNWSEAPAKHENNHKETSGSTSKDHSKQGHKRRSGATQKKTHGKEQQMRPQNKPKK